MFSRRVRVETVEDNPFPEKPLVYLIAVVPSPGIRCSHCGAPSGDRLAFLVGGRPAVVDLCPPCSARAQKASSNRNTRSGGIDWDEQPLGQVPDLALAKRLGVSAKLVKSKRVARGIGHYLDIDWDEQPLGKVADNAIAKRLGVSRNSVARARADRGIPAQWEGIGRFSAHVGRSVPRGKR